MKANDGATLALQPDRSIFVTGSNTAGVVYEIVAVVDTPVTGLRLETIPDSRLPHGGSGRATDNGNFHVAELEVVELKSASLESDVVAQIAIKKHLEDTQGNPAGRSIAKVIDDNRRTLWDTYPNHTSPHWAIFEFAQPLESETGRAVIRIRVDSGISQWGPHGLGRFRLSVTDDARVVECEQQLTSLVSKPSNDIAFLGGAYAMLGETDKASAAFAAAIEQSQDHLARQALISTAARFDGLVSHLSSRLPAEPWLMLARADQCAKRGELEHSIHLRGKAITHLLERGAEEPEVLLQALEEVAVAYVDDGCIDESLQVLRPAYERSREILCPEHPQTINLLGRLADVSEQMREYDHARELRLDEFTLREQMHGLEDPQTLSAGGRLADVYAKCGQISEAIALRVRIAETVPVEDLNASQQTAFFLIWQGDVDRYAVLCRKLLEAADGTEVIKTARDSAKAVLIHPQSDPELVDAAAVLADQAAKRSPTNLWSVLTLGMSHYRQGRLDEAAEYLERAAAAPEVRLSLLARVFLAMTKFRQGDIQKAREQLEEAEQGLGLVAVIDLQSPFVLHHDDLAVWLALREARRLIEIKPDATPDATPDAKDRLLAFQHRAVEKVATDTERSLHLAVLYAWYGDHAAHRDFCRQLIAAARNSQLPRDLERAAKAYLVCPDPEPGLLASAAKCAEEAVGLWEHDHQLRPWAQMAAGMAAYRQQRYAEAIQLLSDAQQVPNRLIKGPALFFRSMTHLRQGHREQARSDFGTAVDLMKPPPDRTASTEAVLEHNELVMWLAHDEANRLLAAEGLPFLADD